MKKIKGFAIVNSVGDICVAYDSANQWTLFPDKKTAKKILKETTIKFQRKCIVPVEIHILAPKKIKKSPTHK